MPLPSVTARRIINEWMKACRLIAAENNDKPWISFVRGDGPYLLLLQEMIAKEIERIQEETSFIP